MLVSNYSNIRILFYWLSMTGKIHFTIISLLGYNIENLKCNTVSIVLSSANPTALCDGIKSKYFSNLKIYVKLSVLVVTANTLFPLLSNLSEHCYWKSLNHII